MSFIVCILLFVAVFIILNFFVAREFYRAAVMKGWSEKKYFWIPFFLSFAGYILVAALPDRGGNADISAIISDDLPDM